MCRLSESLKNLQGPWLSYVDVHPIKIYILLGDCFHMREVFLKEVLVVHSLNYFALMNELAPAAVLAEPLLFEILTLLRFVVGREVSSELQFMLTVCETALVTKFAFSVDGPIVAYFCFVFLCFDVFVLFFDGIIVFSRGIIRMGL